MYDLIIIGAGPGGIALAAEAVRRVLINLNTSPGKGATHNSATRQLYFD